MIILSQVTALEREFIKMLNNRINNQEIKTFFNQKASIWENLERPDQTNAKEIFDRLQLDCGLKIVDVGCGTGFLTPTLLQLHPSKLIGLDLSDNMIEKARILHQADCLEYRIQDILDFDEQGVDVFIIYNAYPHLMNRQQLVQVMKKSLVENGLVVIAHGHSRAQVNSFHQGQSAELSHPLQAIEVEQQIWLNDFKVVDSLENESLYYLVLRKGKMNNV